MSSGTPLPAPISRPCLAGLMLVGSLLLLTALPSPLEEPGDEAVVQVFAPNETQSDSARDLVRRLERVHYLGLPAVEFHSYPRLYRQRHTRGHHHVPRYLERTIHNGPRRAG